MPADRYDADWERRSAFRAIFTMVRGERECYQSERFGWNSFLTYTSWRLSVFELRISPE